MIIKFTSLSELGMLNHDDRDAIMIHVDGNKKFSVYDGELEDNCLSRNFSDCYEIVGLMKIAYEAGLKHEDIEIQFDETDDISEF